MGRRKEVIKFMLTLIFIVIAIIIINIIMDKIDNIKGDTFNTQVTQQMSNECSKEADESVCD